MSNKKSEINRLKLVNEARASHLLIINPQSIKAKISYKIDDSGIDYRSSLQPVLSKCIQNMLVEIVRELDIFEFKINVYFSTEGRNSKNKSLLLEVFSYDNQMNSLGFLVSGDYKNRNINEPSLFDINHIEEFLKNAKNIPSKNFYLYSYHYESNYRGNIYIQNKQISTPLTHLRKCCYLFLDEIEKQSDFNCENEISYITYTCLIGFETDFYVRFSRKSAETVKEYTKLRKLKNINQISLLQSLAESGVIPYDIANNDDLLNTDLKTLFNMIKLLDY